MFYAWRKWITAQISQLAGLSVAGLIIIHFVEGRTNTRWPVMCWFTRLWVMWRISTALNEIKEVLILSCILEKHITYAFWRNVWETKVKHVHLTKLLFIYFVGAFTYCGTFYSYLHASCLCCTLLLWFTLQWLHMFWMSSFNFYSWRLIAIS